MLLIYLLIKNLNPLKAMKSGQENTISKQWLIQ